METMIVKINIKTNRVRANEGSAAFDKRVKAEQNAIKAALHGVSKPATPTTVTLRRVAPGSKMAADLAPYLETIRNFVANWIGQDANIKWRYAQRPGKKEEWFIEVEWT